jgi:hypothetical protein
MHFVQFTQKGGDNWASLTTSSFQKSIKLRPMTQTWFTICENLHVVNTPTFGEIKTGFYNLKTKVLGLSDQ